MPVRHLVIWDAPAVAWSLQEALGPLLPVLVRVWGRCPRSFLLPGILSSSLKSSSRRGAGWQRLWASSAALKGG